MRKEQSWAALNHSIADIVPSGVTELLQTVQSHEMEASEAIRTAFTQIEDSLNSSFQDESNLVLALGNPCSDIALVPNDVSIQQGYREDRYQPTSDVCLAI